MLHDAMLPRTGQTRLGNVTCCRHIYVYVCVSSVSGYVNRLVDVLAAQASHPPASAPASSKAVPAGPFLGHARGTSQTLMNKKSDHYQGAPR